MKNWRGSIMKYNIKALKGNIPYTALNEELDRNDHTYFGYAVSSIVNSPDEILYVASAPRNKDYIGEVFVFDLINSNNPLAPLETKLGVHSRLSGTQMGEYFGYAIVCEDFNNDGFEDIAVSAPMNKNDDKSYDRGIVYVFMNDGDVNIIFNNFMIVLLA